MARFAVIGLGIFGKVLARELMRVGQEVLAIDDDREAVEELQSEVTLAVRLDATDEKALLAQGIDKVDVAIVCMGERFEASILTAALLKQLGVKKIISRATTGNCARILRLVGADETISPEEYSGRRLAQRLANPNIVDFLELSEGYSIVQVEAPSSFHDKQLIKIHLRKNFGVNLVAIRKQVSVKNIDGEERREERVLYNPAASDIIEPGDVLIILGRDEDIARLPID